MRLRPRADEAPPPSAQEALQWLEGYLPADLIVAELKGSSNSLWTISPPSRKNLIDMLMSQEDFPITLSWSVQRYEETPSAAYA